MLRILPFALTAPSFCYPPASLKETPLDIALHRRANFFGNAYAKNLPLSVYFNGKRIGKIGAGERRTLSVPGPGTLQVGVTYADIGLPAGTANSDEITGCLVTSPSLAIAATDGSVRLETGTANWVRFDLLGLCHAPFLSGKVFYLKTPA